MCRLVGLPGFHAILNCAGKLGDAVEPHVQRGSFEGVRLADSPLRVALLQGILNSIRMMGVEKKRNEPAIELLVSKYPLDPLAAVEPLECLERGYDAVYGFGIHHLVTRLFVFAFLRGGVEMLLYLHKYPNQSGVKLPPGFEPQYLRRFRVPKGRFVYTPAHQGVVNVRNGDNPGR